MTSPTEAQLRVMTLVADGFTDREVARTLGLSQHTVRQHIFAVRRVLNARSRTQAVAMLIRQGWLPCGHDVLVSA